MGSRASTAAAESAPGHGDEVKAGAAGRHEEPPVKVHSSWDFTHVAYWVELDDLFQSQKFRRTVEVLKEMRQQELERRFHPNSG